MPRYWPRSGSWSSAISCATEAVPSAHQMNMNVRSASDEKLTRARQDYLKALYHLGGGSSSVSTTHLAEQLAVAPASVTEMLATLRALDLVVYDRYRGASLTTKGVAADLQTIRRHRLLELFLVEMLGYPWEEVHDEAERMEHVISNRSESTRLNSSHVEISYAVFCL